jgi:hypothetical protein
MVPPHCTSYRTCSTEPSGFSAGVWLAGVGETGPLAANDGPASPITLIATAPTTTPALRQRNKPLPRTAHPQLEIKTILRA